MISLRCFSASLSISSDFARGTSPNSRYVALASRGQLPSVESGSHLYKQDPRDVDTVESRLRVLEGRGDREDVGPSREGDSDEGEDAEDENAGGDENEESDEDDGDEGRKVTMAMARKELVTVQTTRTRRKVGPVGLRRPRSLRCR